MEDRSSEGPGARYLQSRVARKGLRPRVAAAMIATLWLAAIVIFGVVQHLVDPETFDSVWLGMWWAMQTVTTVGYGDVIPPDAGGRLVAALLMIGGLSLFAVVTGTITSAFVTSAQAERGDSRDDRVMQRLDQLATDVDEVREELRRRTRSEPSEPDTDPPKP